jgi:hypothetical protein
MVASHSPSPEKIALGEALTELGWTYAWALRFKKARQKLAEGIALMNREPVSNPMQAGFRIRAPRKYGGVQAITFDFTGAKQSLREARRLATLFLVPDQVDIKHRFRR